MNNTFLRINIFTKQDRISMTHEISEALLSSGGFLLDFKQFSNKSICFNFEISPSRVDRLFHNLGELDIVLSKETLQEYEKLTDLAVKRENEVNEQEFIGTLQVTFIHNEKDLKLEVPPG